MTIEEQFYKACQGGTVSAVKKIMANEEFDINEKDADDYAGDTYLHIAMNSNPEIVSLLLAEPNLKLDAVGNSKQTALFEQSNIDCVRLFLNDARCSSEVVNMKDCWGESALSYALKYLESDQDKAVIKLLLDYPGICVNSENKEGHTPLRYAMKKEPEVVSLILADPDTRLDIVDSDGMTDVMAACEEKYEDYVESIKLVMADQRWDPSLVNYDNGREYHNNAALIIAVHNQCDVEILKLLLDQPGVDVNIRDGGGRTPLLLAVGGSQEIMSLLLAHPDIELDVVDNTGNTAVILACSKNSPENLKLLMENERWDSSILNCKSKRNEAALITAVWEGSLDMTRMLLEQININVNIKGKDDTDTGRTALHCAMSKGNLEIVKILLAREDIKLDLVDNDDRTALYYASTNGFADCVKLFLSDVRCSTDIVNHVGVVGSPSNAICQAAYWGYTEIVNMFLDYPGINVHIEDDDGNTPLLKAVESNRIDIVRMLLAHKDTKMDVINHKDDTALFLAARVNSVECTELLLEHEHCTADYINKHNPLSYATYFCPEIAKILLQQPGIDVNYVDGCTGYSPLFNAMFHNHPELVRLLLELENLSLKDENKTILVETCKQEHAECVHIFLGDKRCNADIVNEKNEIGDSALMCAVKNGNSLIVRMILDFPGADPNIMDRYGVTPLLYIMKSGKSLGYIPYPSYEAENILKLLLRNKRTKLDCTTVEGETALDKCDDAELVKLITADARCTPDLLNHKTGDTGETFLTRAVKSGLIEVVKVLVNHPDIDCNTGNTLAYAMERNLPDMLSVLLTNPVLVLNVGDALITACRHNYIQCVRQLVLDRRCSPEVLNRKNDMYGETALMTAVAYEHTEIVELLAGLPGIDFSLENKAGKTVMDLAKESFHNTCVKILKGKQSS